MSFPRFQSVVIPILRDHLPTNVHVASWINDIDHRQYPIVLVRRVGGYRDLDCPRWLDKPVVEMTVLHDEGLVEAEELYSQALTALFKAVRTQTVANGCNLTFIKETMGMTQFSSLFSDTYRVQGLIQIGVRSHNKEY